MKAKKRRARTFWLNIYKYPEGLGGYVYTTRKQALSICAPYATTIKVTEQLPKRRGK